MCATLLALLASYLFARHEVEEVYDAQLVHSAKVLLQLTQHEISRNEEFHLGIENPDLQHKYERNLGFRIWVDNRIITQSPITEVFSDFEAPPGFSDQVIAGHEWRVFVFIDTKNKIKIEVSERYDIRYELIIQLMMALILPALAFLPIILIIIWIGVRKVLKPVVKISADVDRRSTHDLSPIKKENLPREIAPLVQALNRLFERIQESFNRERQFTDNAAHELRTPLAAMKTQAQVLLKKAADMPECSADLDNLHASIDRAAHMVDQLLSFTRLQGDQIEFETLNLSALTSEVLKEISPLAVKKKINLEADITPGIKVRGNQHALEIVVRNLIDNAIKFTPAKGRIDVSVHEENGDIVVVKISDSGLGISDSEKQNVFERFYRVQKHKQGSGLGLSMTKWVCDLHGAEILLSDNTPSGLCVNVTIKSV
ncbi:MAG: sensor histidine kinase N-terminal domain-containing protein [Alphaproteobacteria bacterium]|nr:sensor histidine kinase N-terminal domain-containing protein [Alphaproteobacteria bacterium]